jgi:hypothetical protein
MRLTRVFRGDDKVGDGVGDAKHKVGDGEPPDVDHGAAERGLDHAVAHADDQEQEEGE